MIDTVHTNSQRIYKILSAFNASVDLLETQLRTSNCTHVEGVLQEIKEARGCMLALEKSINQSVIAYDRASWWAMFK
jgi:hypothetical protein